MISHVALVVSDLHASEAFYLYLLGPLGFQKVDFGLGYVRISNGRDAVLVLLPHQGAEPSTFHRHGVGLNHIAFQAPSRGIVDQIADGMAALGHPTVGEGKVDTGYRGPYYTVSYLDPDGVMIEIVYHREGYFSLQCHDLFPSEGES